MKSKADLPEMIGTFLGAILLATAGTSVWAIIVVFPVMWLWNWLTPTLFKLPEIGFFQAIGLILLCNILFRGHVSIKK